MEAAAAAAAATSSSPITLPNAASSADPTPPSTRPSSLQPDAGVLNPSPDSAEAAADAEFGFARPEMGRDPLAGTVGAHERHLFLCYKSPDVWPARVEAAEFDRLPRLLSAALKSRKDHIKKQTRLTICEGEDGTESSNGDVLIFPEMIRYSRLTHFDVDNFVEEVLVKETEWLPGAVETLTGSYVFVCAHGSRDRRCGVCGPVLVRRFKEEINLRGLQGQVSVSPCSHIGGHKYAGNVIIFSPNVNGEVTGHWYGYVTPEDVPTLLEQHIGKGEIISHLWRGQMGLSEEEQKKAQELRLQLNGGTMEKIAQGDLKEIVAADPVANGTELATGGCCQGTRNFSCCQNGSSEDKLDSNRTDDREADNVVAVKKTRKENKSSSTRRACGTSTWFENWEREDTYAALAVVAAVASVAVAYSYYRQLR